MERRITAFLKTNRGLDFCDDCLAREVRIPPRQVRELASVLRPPDFERRTGLCAACLRNGRVVGCPIT